MSSARPIHLRPRRGFTVTELLVAMALILVILVLLTQAFSEGLKAFREVKAIGDLNERLRTASAQLRRDLLESHFEGAKFVGDSLLNGKANREEAAAVRERYEAIAADARVLKTQFRQLELRVTNPVDKRILRRIQETLGQIELQAVNVVAVMRAIEDDDDDDDGESSGGTPLAR